jgi:hypothetical protein
MKPICITLVALLLTITAHAQLAASFSWQGHIFTNPRFTVMDAENVQVSGSGASVKAVTVPFAKLPPAIQRQLAAQRDFKARGGKIIHGKVVQVLPGGVLVDTSTTVSHFSSIGGRSLATGTETVPGEWYFLTGHPEQEQLVDGKTVWVAATNEGRYTYTAVNGAARTVAQMRYLEDGAKAEGISAQSAPAFGGAPARSVATPSPFGPGSKMQGGAMDRKPAR